MGPRGCLSCPSLRAQGIGHQPLPQDPERLSLTHTATVHGHVSHGASSRPEVRTESPLWPAWETGIMRSNFSIWWSCLFSTRGEQQQQCWLWVIKGANTWGGAVGPGLGVGSLCGRGLVVGGHPPGEDAPFVTHRRGLASGKPTQPAEVSLTHRL